MLAFSETDCSKAREAISARLDGELPELGLERVKLHLRDCHPCRVWAEQVEAATLELREARLELPAARITLSRRGRRRTTSLALAAGVAAVAASFVAAFGQQGLVSSQQTTSTGPQQEASTFQERLHGVDENAFARVFLPNAPRGRFRAI